MLAILGLLLPVVFSVNVNQGLFVSNENRTWPSAYSHCRNMSMNIFNNSEDVELMRRCHGVEHDIWINYPINLYDWKFEGYLQRDGDSLDECLVMHCQEEVIRQHHCIEQVTCVCARKNYISDINLNYSQCKTFCQKRNFRIIDISSAREFYSSHNISLFWGNDESITFLNISTNQEIIEAEHLCLISTSYGAKKFRRCGAMFPFICLADGFRPCVQQNTTTRTPSSTTSSSIKTYSTSTTTASRKPTSPTVSNTKKPSTPNSTNKYSTSIATTLPSTKPSRQTYTSPGSVSPSKTHSLTTSTSAALLLTSSTSSSLDGDGMKTADEETDSSTLLVAALVTSIVVVAALLGVIFLLFRRMRRLTKDGQYNDDKGSHSNDGSESRPRDLYEDSTNRLSQHEYQEIDKVKLFRHIKVNDDDENIENTYTEILPDIDTNYVTLENDSSGKRQTGPEWISTHNTLDEPDNSQKESTGRVNLSFETDSTYFVLDKI